MLQCMWSHPDLLYSGVFYISLMLVLCFFCEWLCPAHRLQFCSQQLTTGEMFVAPSLCIILSLSSPLQCLQVLNAWYCILFQRLKWLFTQNNYYCYIMYNNGCYMHNCTRWNNSWNKVGNSPLISGLLLFNAKTNLQAGQIFTQRVVSPKAHLNAKSVAHYKQWQQCFLLAPWSCLVWTVVSSDHCSLFR